jgi:tryptophan synthase alpha chain
MDRYAAMFARLAASGEGAFGAFVMLGDPDLATSARILDALVAAGVDMIEVGIPFSDPVADGPVIQAAATRALAAGVRPAACFALLRGFRERHPLVPVGILTYANLVVARGRDHFYRSAAEAGTDSLLVADVPLLEAEPFVADARAAGIAPVLIAAPNTPAQRLRRIAALGGGYTYCVSRPGVTGSGDPADFGQASLLRTLREAGAPPPIVGFGISRPEHVRTALDTGAAGVICGSAIVQRIAANPGAWETALRDFLEPMLAATEPIAASCI